MKGYLSRIARQSGLRYSQPGFEARALTAGSRIADALPPDVEQTVMVGPALPEIKDAVALESKGAQKKQTGLEQEHTEDAGKSHEVRIREDIAMQAPIQREMQTRLAGRRTAAAAIENSDNATRLAPQNPLIEDRVSGAPRVVEQIALKEPDSSEDGREQTRHADSAERAGVLEAKPSETTSGPVTETKEYFARTAGILNNKETVTPELQAVVLQEVQEWVAASPAGPQIAQADSQMRDAVHVAKAAQSRAPAVVTIRASEQLDKPDQTRPIEQKFDLSIGAINVTIEESEKPRPPERPTQQPNKAARDNESRFSRLSRSYL
jgi:hypothetical protein